MTSTVVTGPLGKEEKKAICSKYLMIDTKLHSYLSYTCPFFCSSVQNSRSERNDGEELNGKSTQVDSSPFKSVLYALLVLFSFELERVVLSM